MMLASASGELKTRVPPNARCRPCVTLKTPPLPGHRLERRLAARVGDVLAEHDDARVARHLVLHRPVDRRDHRVGLAFRRRLGREVGGRRIDVRRVDVERRRVGRRLLGLHRRVGGGVDLLLDLLDDRLELAPRSRCPRRRGTPPCRVIGSRFASSARSSFVLYSFSSSDSECEYGRIDLGVDERRALARARVGDAPRHRLVAGRGSRCRRCSGRRGRGTTRRASRGRRRRSALRPAPRSRSRCLRSGRRPGACRCTPEFSDSQNSPSLDVPSPIET